MPDVCVPGGRYPGGLFVSSGCAEGSGSAVDPEADTPVDSEAETSPQTQMDKHTPWTQTQTPLPTQRQKSPGPTGRQLFPGRDGHILLECILVFFLNF